MSRKEFEVTQVISAACFDLVRQGYSLDEIECGLSNVMSAIGSSDSALEDAQKLLNEFEQTEKELREQSDFYKNGGINMLGRKGKCQTVPYGKVVEGPDKWFEHGGCVTGKATDNVAKKPHIRIEFDDITDTPKVFIDGVEQRAQHHIELDWSADTAGGGRYMFDFMDSFGRLHRTSQGE